MLSGTNKFIDVIFILFLFNKVFDSKPSSWVSSKYNLFNLTTNRHRGYSLAFPVFPVRIINLLQELITSLNYKEMRFTAIQIDE